MIEHQVRNQRASHPVSAGAVDQGRTVGGAAHHLGDAIEGFVAQVSISNHDIDVLQAQLGEESRFVESARFHWITDIDHHLDAGVLERAKVGR